MAKTIKERNQMECNRKARKKYTEKNFKYQTVCFKISELEEIDKFCKEHNIPKNTFFRKVIMYHINNPLEWFDFYD